MVESEEPAGQDPTPTSSIQDLVIIALRSKEFGLQFSELPVVKRRELMNALKEQIDYLRRLNKQLNQEDLQEFRTRRSLKSQDITDPQQAIAKICRKGKYLDQDLMEQLSLDPKIPPRVLILLTSYSEHIVQFGKDSIAHLCPSSGIFRLTNGVYLTTSNNRERRRVQIDTIDQMRNFLDILSTEKEIEVFYRYPTRAWSDKESNIGYLKFNVEHPLKMWGTIGEEPQPQQPQTQP